ncbi:VOC family protein [Paenibacillus agricola]|uniref:VOC family protein n=1 Tax=Paenibacillus agricola TaxID=2716264 RepID=A0ABX0JFY4_9BACL|nr:VOC family protein [Paenibacillus agricola]NHN34126.1 VOC family protein [Paenibacillus agricola]
MKIKSRGISEAVLEVINMDLSVEFWHKKLGFPIVDQWGYSDGQFNKNTEQIWATWLYVGGSTRLGLWLPREFSQEQLLEKSKLISGWNGLFDEGGIHVHLALYIDHNDIDDAINRLEECNIDYKIIINNLGHKRIYFKDTENNVIEFYTLNMHEDYLMRLNKGLLQNIED